MTRLRVLLAVLLRRSRLEVPAADWEGPGEREAAPATCRQGKSNLLCLKPGHDSDALLPLRVQAADLQLVEQHLLLCWSMPF